MKRGFIPKVNKFFKNQVLVYFLIRYGVYFLQFLISIVIAVKLGTYYFSIWSFLLLILSYFQVVDFGISNSMNVLLVQYKNDDKKVKDITTSSYYLVSGLVFIVFFIGVYYFFFGFDYFKKNNVGYYFYIICFIASYSYFNKLLMTIHRVKNQLTQISFFQAIIQILVFVAMLITKEKELLVLIVMSYLIGHILSFLVFVFSGFLPKKGVLKKKYIKLIIQKGWYLFIYNVSFYLLAISTRTIVNIFYSSESFALFSFSYTLANAIILLLEAMGFVIFPKMIDKFSNNNSTEVKKLIKSIQENYVTLAYGLIYFSLIIFPIFIHFTPKYKDALMSLNLTALSIVAYINAFGYNTYLIANNEEKIISKISLLILGLNLLLAIFISNLFKDNYSYTIFSLLISYIFFTVFLVYQGNVKLKQKKSFFICLIESYPLRLVIPHILAILIVITQKENNLMLGLPFVVFLILNFKYIKSIISIFFKILKKPSIVNI